jgi:lysophospholipase L1-like esterase
VRKPRLVTLIASLTAAVTAAVGFAVPAQAAGARYVALGDSYASGLGADNYTAESGSCYRSYNAYPAVYAANNAPASYRSVACSGATTDDVINSQVAALSSTTNLISLTIGGNDVGFSDIMYTCVAYGETECIAAVDRAEVKAKTELPHKLDNTYNAIRARSPYARVVVLDYPEFYQLNVWGCVGLSEKSRAKINEGINLLDSIIKDAVSRHGFVFGDVRSIFVGHQLCSGDKWLHALNWSDIKVSYHPFASGQGYGYYPVFRNAAGF